nr:MAG TPA: Single strand binding protein [Caudoviricetes sp.]
MFGNRAASVSRFLSKGSKVAIEGKLRWSQWETQDGGKRSKLEVVVDELEFMSRNENGSQGQAYGRGEVAHPAMEAVPYDDEIPF